MAKKGKWFKELFQPKKEAARKKEENRVAAEEEAATAAANAPAPTQQPVLIIPNPVQQPVLANIGLASVPEPPVPYKRKRTPNPVQRASGITYELISTDKVFTKEINLDTVVPVKALPYERNALGTIMLDLNKDLSNNKGMYNLYTPKFSQKKFAEVIDVAFEEFIELTPENDLEYLQKLLAAKSGQVIVLTAQQKKNAEALDDMRKKVLAAKAAEEEALKAKRKVENDLITANAAAGSAREAEAAAKAEAEKQKSMRADIKISNTAQAAVKSVGNTAQAAVKSVGNAVRSVGSSIKKFFSDSELKTEIQLIGQSPSGINIYQFKYKSDPYKRTYQGVIADEIVDSEFADAVTVDDSGYLTVDYSKIDVEFKDVSQPGNA